MALAAAVAACAVPVPFPRIIDQDVSSNGMSLDLIVEDRTGLVTMVSGVETPEERPAGVAVEVENVGPQVLRVGWAGTSVSPSPVIRLERSGDHLLLTLLQSRTTNLEDVSIEYGVDLATSADVDATRVEARQVDELPEPSGSGPHG